MTKFKIINCNPRSPTRPIANGGGSGILISGKFMFCLQTTPHYVLVDDNVNNLPLKEEASNDGMMVTVH